MTDRRLSQSPNTVPPLASALFLLGLFLISVLLVASDLRAAETCSGGFSEFELLQPGDDGSGIGGTGLGESRSSDEFRHARTSQPGDENDSGIGGTGRSPRPPGDDESGIGGTGVYGTVTRTDRLCVSGIEIEVPSHLAMESSTSAATLAADRGLATGQVVFVIAARTDDGLIARKIVLESPYAGQIEEVGSGGGVLFISGRRLRVPEAVVRGDGLTQEPLRKGQWIRFHGLPDASDTLVVSRLERGQPGETGRLGDAAGNAAPRWLEALSGLEYVSLEGYVTADRAGLRVARVPLELGSASSAALRQGLHPGARVRVGGRVGADHVLRVTPPPKWLRPLRGDSRPTLDPDRTPSGAGDPPQTESPPRPQSVPPKPATPPADRPNKIDVPRPDRRPEIRRPMPDRVKPVRPPDRIRPDIVRP